MLCTVDPAIWTADPKDAPMPLRVLPEDTALAEEIKTYFKRLLFAAIEGENEFQTNINGFLSSEEIAAKNFGYIACLPSVYARDKVQNTVKRAARTVEEGGTVGSRALSSEPAFRRTAAASGHRAGAGHAAPGDVVR